MTVQAGRADAAALAQAMTDPALRPVGRVAQSEPRFALPTFLWATGSERPAFVTPGRSATTTDAARFHLDRVAPFYRLARTDVRGATLRRVHDTGRGGTIASFTQVIDGVEVFGEAMNVMMDRSQSLVAVSGFLPAANLLGTGASRTFRLSAMEAASVALSDFSGMGLGAGAMRMGPPADGGYQTLSLRDGIPGLAANTPIRIRRVWYHLPGALLPAWHVEVVGDPEAYAYVIAAADGEILFRHSLVADDSYSYRVWADAASPFLSWDGPQGLAASPHPTGTLDLYNPPFAAPGLVTLQNGPISTNDPWLPPGATETVGNNIDAYVDLSSPDGLSAGDFRASTTAPGTFDRAYDPLQEPTSAAQRMAAVAQIFYTTNLLHDWFYDSGFDEASGNAQQSNYGRGGVEGDRLRAEGQDYSGINNANMMTPSDGGSPRMQMYVFNRGGGNLIVTAPGSLAGTYPAGTANFGPQRIRSPTRSWPRSTPSLRPVTPAARS